ncbi:MAG: hypothetical protein H6757_01880 [Candidatus Omnitrophica bacterium]|nr:hypothetical protein [Candidatus Omnitrophota bacterium]
MTSSSDSDLFRQKIQSARRITVLTGAGISTESGISDYRSKGGLWDKFQPVTIQEFIEDEAMRKEYWRRKKEMYAQIKDALPNAGHLALAKLEERGHLTGLITQNIDGLHRRAGSTKMIELHGTNREVICLSCEKIDSFDTVYGRLLEGDEAPLCMDCGGLLKPNTISFGQALNPDHLNQAINWARDCDLFIAVGSTLIVEPAASLPAIARRSGACLAIINQTDTPFSKTADFNFSVKIGEFLKNLID